MRAPTTSETLDPRLFAYVNSRDMSDDEPSTAVAVVVAIDDPDGQVTASLATLPSDLADVIPWAQVLFVAADDPERPAPVQVGRFDGRLPDFSLGAPTLIRSVDAAAYVLARRTSIDCYEKRGVRGFAVFVVDSSPPDIVDPERLHAVVGDAIEGPMDTVTMFEELRERYRLIALIPADTDQRVADFWVYAGASVVTFGAGTSVATAVLRSIETAGQEVV